MSLVVARDVKALGQRLLPYVEVLGGAASLSPDRSPVPNVPVFLLHGTDDNIIPSDETPLTADYLRGHGNSRVEWLETPLLSHANVQSARHLSDAWRLIAFWKRMLSI
jgi:predicted esterase